MEDKRYFTPDIEDIRVGYECEMSMDTKEKNWRKVIIRQEDFTPYSWYDHHQERPTYRQVVFRTPYLTGEQIEAEGWTFKQTNKIRYWYEKTNPEVGGNWYRYKIYNAKLIHDPEMNLVKILFSFDAVEDECVFEGECKDISTFK